MPLGAYRLNGLARFVLVAEAEVIRKKIGVSAIGNAQVDTAQSKFGGASALFDGTGDYLNISPTTNLVFGTGDFTIEMWVYRTADVADTPQIFYDGRDTSQFSQLSPVLYFDTPGLTNPLKFYNGADRIISGSTSANTWYHIAVSRNSGVTKMFLNGTQAGNTYTDNSNYIISSSLWIGSHRAIGGSNAFGLRGHIDEVRISNIARYTSNFTPSTTPFQNDSNTLLLLHMDGTDASTVFEDDVGVRSKIGIRAIGNAQVDTAQSKYGGSSALFDGSGDNLNTAFLSQMAFGTSDFTMEAWVRTTTTVSQVIISGRYGTGNTVSQNNNVMAIVSGKLSWSNGQIWAIQDSVNITTNTWVHCAVVRSNGVMTLYKDGTSIGTYSYSTSIDGDRPIYIGAFNTGATVFNGHIDEVRISNIARYTSNFTPSITPFVNDADTIFLCHADGTDASTFFEDDNGVRSKQGVSAIGNAQIDTAQSKFGGSSYLGDGSSDNLSIPDLRIPQTGNFTLECWFRPANTGERFDLIATNTTGEGRTFCNTTTSNQIQAFIGTTVGNLLLTSTTTYSANTWYHYAFVRNGNNYYLFLDGNLEASETVGTNRSIAQVAVLIGARPSFGNDAMNGHIDEVRISNTARYTANFTPSTTPFQNDSNTLLLLHMNGTDASTVFTDDNGVPPDYEY